MNAVSPVVMQVDSNVLAILSYHKIGPAPGGWETWFYIPEETFAAQLGYLAEQGWQIIDVDAFMRGLQEPGCLPERAALLTFDDGFRSMRTVTLPWLRRFGYPAVLFVPTDFIGGRNWFDADWEPEEEICDWDDLHALQAAGISIQSHSASHRRFSELEAGEQEEEIIRSKATLEAELGNSVEMIAFPYGDAGREPDHIRRTLVQVGYRAACMYGGGTVPIVAADPYGLPRIAMGPDTDLASELG